MEKQKSNPMFSIVIANFNSGKYLEECILSIITQSIDDFELIIIDGKSQDNSIDIIKKYSNKLSYWISEKDNGQSDAFNKGFSKAKGEYYFWINADDILLPNSLEYAKKEILKNTKVKWISANTIFCDENGLIKKCSVGPKWNSFLIKHNPIYVHGPTSIFHKSLFEEVGGFNVSLHYTMDTDLWYKFYNNGHKFKKINEFFWVFRVHVDSKTSHSFSQKPNNDYKSLM